VTPSEVSAREDFGRRSPGLLLSATGGDGRGDGGTRDCEEGKNSKLETGNFGGKSEKKEAHAMRETEEETRDDDGEASSVPSFRSLTAWTCYWDRANFFFSFAKLPSKYHVADIMGP